MTNLFQDTVADIIRTKRRDKGKTQEDIADAIGVDTSFVGQIESGKKYYNLEHINKIAIFLDCSPKELMPENFIKED